MFVSLDTVQARWVNFVEIFLVEWQSRVQRETVLNSNQDKTPQPDVPPAHPDVYLNNKANVDYQYLEKCIFLKENASLNNSVWYMHAHMHTYWMHFMSWIQYSFVFGLFWISSIQKEHCEWSVNTTWDNCTTYSFSNEFKQAIDILCALTYHSKYILHRNDKRRINQFSLAPCKSQFCYAVLATIWLDS